MEVYLLSFQKKNLLYYLEIISFRYKYYIQNDYLNIFFIVIIIIQVEQMYNITKAKYKQLKEIRNVNFSEVDPAEEEMMKKMTKTHKKRMMQLKLTDGLQNIIGIEYNPIPQLNVC